MAVSSSSQVFFIGVVYVLGIVSLNLYFGFVKPLQLLHPRRKFVYVNKSLVSPAYRVCKPGPPLGYPEQPSKIKNCLVIGDSISIGYVPFLRDQLEDVCRVQRSPVDDQYGGARDSRYGLHCLEMFLRTTSGNSTFYDVIFINFGLHDITYLYDRKFINITLSEYSSNLASIKRQLLRTGAKLVFLTTTPAPHKERINTDIATYNSEAIKIMKAKPKAMVYDLYQTVVDICHGNTTERFQKCGIFRSPSDDHHFNTRGSYEIARHLAEVLRRILLEASSTPSMFTQDKTGLSPDWIRCPGANAIVGCPPDSSCCKIKYTESGVGCCHLSNPVQCGDDNHYCDQGWICDPKCWVMKCFCHKNITVRTRVSLSMH